MPSLKSFLVAFSAATNISPVALYERQRALVRHGVLIPIAGRGPGSGVELSSYSVATLMIACAAAPSLSDVDGRITEYCEAPSIGKKCPLTEKKTFREAVQKILEDKAIMECVYAISVTHDFPEGTIHFAKARTRMGDGVFRWTKIPPRKGIESSSTIYVPHLKKLCYYFNKEADIYERSS